MWREMSAHSYAQLQHMSPLYLLPYNEALVYNNKKEWGKDNTQIKGNVCIIKIICENDEKEWTESVFCSDNTKRKQPCQPHTQWTDKGCLLLTGNVGPMKDHVQDIQKYRQQIQQESLEKEYNVEWTVIKDFQKFYKSMHSYHYIYPAYKSSRMKANFLQLCFSI